MVYDSLVIYFFENIVPNVVVISRSITDMNDLPMSLRSHHQNGRGTLVISKGLPVDIYHELSSQMSYRLKTFVQNPAQPNHLFLAPTRS